jgi:hypothetical protein
MEYCFHLWAVSQATKGLSQDKFIKVHKYITRKSGNRCGQV